MKVFYAGDERRKKEIVDAIALYNGQEKIEIVDNRLDSEATLSESTVLTVAANEHYAEKIHSEKDTEELVLDVLRFFERTIAVNKRMCKLTTTLSLWSPRGIELKKTEQATEYFLMETPWDKEYTGYDLDTILFKKEINRTVSSMDEKQRLVYSPRAKAIKELLQTL